MGEALRFLLLAELLGLAAAPLAALLFGRLPGDGAGFEKALGLLGVTWLAWFACSVGVPYGTPAAIGAVVVLAAAGGAAFHVRRQHVRLVPAPGTLAWEPVRGVPFDPIRRRHRRWGEAVFVVAFIVMALVCSYSPDVRGTEKPMDMAFVNAVNASDSFPPHDPWQAGENLDYYYLGHVAAALAIRLTGVEPTVGYNLSLALLYALAAAAAFGLAAAWAASRPGQDRPVGRSRADRLGRSPVATGIAAAVLTLVLGNLAAAEELLTDQGKLIDFDWFSASRVVPNTINEFPSFAWVLGDLHAHVIAIPFMLLALGLALQILLSGPRLEAGVAAALELAAAGIVVGSLYAINAWSYPVVAGLVLVALLGWMRDPASRGQRVAALAWAGLFLGATVLAVLPFHLTFETAEHGLALVDERRSFTHFVRDHALMYGLFAWLLLAPATAALLRTRKPVRNLVWGLVAAAFAGSALATADLAGVALLAFALALALYGLLGRESSQAERFLWLLAAGAITCVLLGEVVYVRDAFDGGPFFRMNTVFKLGSMAWILFALAGAAALAVAPAWLPRVLLRPWAIGATALAVLSLAFPTAGTYARKAGFEDGPRLDGLQWLRASAPGDVEAIDWLRDNAAGDAVVLEAVGDDYSEFGHGRIATNTGRPTVLGWAGHELQWGHDPGDRRAEVQRAYETSDPALARQTLQRYGVQYVVLGPLERTDYGEPGVAKWDQLGRRVFDRDGTIVFQIS